MTPREICIDLPHIRLAGQRWGEGEHIVLALHGWLDNAASFAPLAPHLIDDNTSLIALEFAGHGRSAHRPLGAGYHFTDHMRDAMYAAETPGIQKIDNAGMQGMPGNGVETRDFRQPVAQHQHQKSLGLHLISTI